MNLDKKERKSLDVNDKRKNKKEMEENKKEKRKRKKGFNFISI